jgi:epoxyqueuosine reductase
MATLEQRLLDHAYQLGFALAGIAPATPADGFDRLRAWLDQGYAGQMHYMHRHADARGDPRSILPTVRSVVMVGMNYAPLSRRTNGPPVPGAKVDSAAGQVKGRIARYAQGADYHAVLRAKLRQLGGWLREQQPGCWGRGVVDTAPLLERDFARRAGLGWFGKNTMLLNKRLGSWFVLGGLLVDIDLQPSEPFSASHCGTCTACLDACPTGAFVEPFVLDSRRCISYLTIELHTQVPAEMRPAIGDWLFGCDICQEVCPWNRKAPPGSPELAARDDLVNVDPVELLGLSEEAFRERFLGTALFPRPGRPVVLRNAALILGNSGDSRALPALRRALDDPAELVCEAAAWAISRIEQRSVLSVP